MEQIEALLRLPFETLALISAGYVAYRIAYVGKDGNHATVDVVFITFVFAFVAKVSSGWSLLPVGDLTEVNKQIAEGIVGIFAAVFVSAIWRKWGESLAFWTLRKMRISASDRHETAWLSLLARPPKMGPTRLFVRCANGTRLLCERLHDFNDAPLGPCLFGQDGSIAIYVTHRKITAESDWETENDLSAVDSSWGFTLTFVPADQVMEVRLDYPFNPSVLAVGGMAAHSA